MTATAAALVAAMANLRPRDDGYLYQNVADPTEMGQKVEAVQVSVTYYKGRGVYVNVAPVTRERWEYGCSTGHMLFSGVNTRVLAMARGNPKKLAAVAARLDPIVPKLAEIWGGVSHKMPMSPADRLAEDGAKAGMTALLHETMAGFAV
jgi:hypothetical protein